MGLQAFVSRKTVSCIHDGYAVLLLHNILESWHDFD